MDHSVSVQIPELSPDEQRRLRQLGEDGDVRILTADEKQELQMLMEKYDGAVLRRAQAFAFLAPSGDEVGE